MHGLALFALEPTPVHPVIGLQVPNYRLDGLSALEPFALLGTHGFEPAAVYDLSCHQVVNTPVTQINDGRGGFDIEVLQQVSGLLNLFGQGMAVLGEAPRECPGANVQALFVGDRDAGLHAELVGPAALALADALSFRCVQGIQLILVLGLLSADALGQGDLIVWLIVDAARTRPVPKKVIRGGHAVACF